jgi:hypothetical protein
MSGKELVKVRVSERIKMISASWIFKGNIARNAFLRDSRRTKPYVFPQIAGKL